ncbi:MAG TPA: hypothetical protein VK031_07970 [Tissierellaceae bacterium]|nr:hypothetical protein [Tissierellaceae bacterium]
MNNQDPVGVGQIQIPLPEYPEWILDYLAPKLLEYAKKVQRDAIKYFIENMRGDNGNY